MLHVVRERLYSCQFLPSIIGIVCSWPTKQYAFVSPFGTPCGGAASGNGQSYERQTGWLGSRVVSVLDSSAEGPGFKSHDSRHLQDDCQEPVSAAEHYAWQSSMSSPLKRQTCQDEAKNLCSICSRAAMTRQSPAIWGRVVCLPFVSTCQYTYRW